VSRHADTVFRRRCDRCGIGESDPTAHLAFNVVSGRLSHVFCGEIVPVSEFAEHRRHSARTMANPFAGNVEVSVDDGMVPIIERLWQLGIETDECCQGFETEQRRIDPHSEMGLQWDFDVDVFYVGFPSLEAAKRFQRAVETGSNCPRLRYQWAWRLVGGASGSVAVYIPTAWREQVAEWLSHIEPPATELGDGHS
jgi:hypothetical protein